MNNDTFFYLQPKLSLGFIFARISVLPRYYTTGMDINLWNQFRLSTFVEYGQSYLWFQTMPMSWFIQTFVISSQGAEIGWQWFIVILEIAIGVALILGLFTTLASVLSIKFIFGIMMTVGMAMASWWFIFAAVAFLFTAGRVFSIDYYLMPKLKQRWKNSRFGGKWYLYNE